MVNPHPFLEELAGEVVLREVIELAEAAPGLSDEQLRARLLTSLITLAQHARTWPG